jgi:endogenous inhibitor of DNA gyrase (YacG/DUF329 family)
MQDPKDSTAAAGSGPSKAACPICGRPRDPAYRPFCSKRCADVDLARWLRGTYVIATDEEDGEERAPPTAKGENH